MKFKKLAIVAAAVTLGFSVGSIATANPFHHLHHINRRIRHQNHALRRAIRNGNFSGVLHHVAHLEHLHVRKHIVKRRIRHGWW